MSSKITTTEKLSMMDDEFLAEIAKQQSHDTLFAVSIIGGMILTIVVGLYHTLL